MSNKPLSDEAGEVRELAAADIKRMKPASDVLPDDLVAILPKRKRSRRGPAKRPTKESITLRLDPEIVQHFRSTGPRMARQDQQEAEGRNRSKPLSGLRVDPLASRRGSHLRQAIAKLLLKQTDSNCCGCSV